MKDAEDTTGPRPVHPRCSAAAGTPQVQPDTDRSADAVSEHLDMTRERYEEFDEAGKIPKEWVDAGWHFCCELDYALVNKEDVAGFCRVVRRLWREISGYNAMRRERIAKRKLARIFDDAERKLEALKEQATGVERIRCINDIFWVRTQRSYRGV